MKKTLGDLAKLALPMRTEKRDALATAAPYLDKEDLQALKRYLKTDRCFAVTQRFGTSAELFEDTAWPSFKSHRGDREVDAFLGRINAAIIQQSSERTFLAFAPHAIERISGLLAQHIVGMEGAKRAAALLLFAKDPLHLLLIGDPGTGKTDILRSVQRLAPVSSFGLGSGISGVGLSAVAKGDTVLKGLLPLADGGVACIDELNLIRPKDLASLYNAMEKGFVTYDKGTKHEQLPARVRVIATANPSTGSFIGHSAEVLRKQIPFDDPLLSRFHLIFIIRKPSEREFAEIASRIVRGEGATVSDADAAFIAQYVERASTVDVRIEPRLEARIVAFVKDIKADERKLLIEVGPRTVVGAVRTVKAIARAELSPAATDRHIDLAFALLRDALSVRKGEPA